ncbi:SDR family NAD(P)-dependent oxidoreductase [Paraburkholderia sp. DHOC27]|uniref:SDR family NAD(P)-dependent oxidoreductase n=1 Tax=Paraburkholderia sp. DHOC27 TaxID=2303330 RepID=UPI000E3DA953|nr:SDR family oxidoreductase [Paraburkholderia sp. DHOC27]RFU45463.1 SDR family oxidoreductase [Paraburkholderia sp. DHOC27]
MKLAGKIALVTGANSGIGFATAKTLIEQGAERVYITGRRKDELAQAAASLGERAVAVQGDVTSQADLDRLYEQVKAEVGHLDIVFANAGFAAFSPLGGLTEEHVDGLLNTNVKGVIWTVQKALPLMRSGGSIILSASIVASKGFANWSIYSATKAAVRSFARTWASDLKGRNIRVNAVSPGVVVTPGHDKTGASKDDLAGFFGFAASITPLGRTGNDTEIANVVAFLASDDSSFVTGSEIFVDGGIAQI